MILPQSTSWSTCLPSCFPMNIAIISRFPVRLATTGGTIYGQLGGGHGLFWRSGSARWIITRHSGWVHPKDRGFTNKGGRDWPHQETWDSTNQDEGCKHGAKIYRQKNGETKWWKYGGLKAPTNGDKLQCDASKCNYQKWALRWCQHKLLFQSRIVKSDWLQLAEVLVWTELLTKSSQCNVMGQHSTDPTIEYPGSWAASTFNVSGRLGPQGVLFSYRLPLWSVWTPASFPKSACESFCS